MQMDAVLDIMFHHGGMFQKDENGITIYSPDKKACVGDIDQDTLDVFWHVPRRSLDSGLRALNSNDELREMCFMAQENDGLIDIYFEHAVSSPELIEGKEIVLYVEDEHDEPKKDSPAKPNEKDVTMSGNEPLASKIHEEATCPLSDNNEPRTTSNSNPNKGNKSIALADNTSPPNNIEPTNHGSNNPTPHIKESRTNNNANQNATAKPNMKTPPTCPKTKSKKKTISNPKSSNDSSYEPGRDDSSSGDDTNGKIDKDKARNFKLSHAPAEAFAKSKRKLINDEDALVVDNEECEVDLNFLQVPVTGDEELDNALDPGAESDGANSWHSEELKTPPPSEEEFSEEEADDVFPFGDLKLEVGMKFNTKYEFREAVREFTIQEGRRI
ncbi:hypothetical protein Ahy_A05g023744 [Arachis hypogaea]|uniref:PB1-like domain-containing protein n=1 Tax=Arachis hypogaea TaxID=3818 RepID=A0A445D4B1_ARAHY|nr:hypothetical protein Ahy_A05g023744 [Arachis hypogaea]